MNLFFNTIALFLIFLLFHLVALGYGLIFKKNISDNTIGEIGISGFITIYLISISTHFFSAINNIIIYIFLIIGLYLFLINFKYLKKKFEINLSLTAILLLSFLSINTNSLHDDFYWYHLPTINYIQNSKIIFGVGAINDLLNFGHGYYNIASLFSFPFLKGNIIYLPAIIFLNFFFLHICEIKKNNNFLVINTFVYIIILITLFRFTRFKEFGIEIVAFSIIALIQLYLIEFFINKNKIYFEKSIILLIFGFFIKPYIVFVGFVLIYYFFFFKKKIFHLLKFKKVLLILFIIIISFAKNFIQSGCILYPYSQTCFKKEIISWSIEDEVAKKRLDQLKSLTRGIAVYSKFDKSETITADEYLKKFKFNYLKNVIKDPDINKLLICLVLILIIKFIFIFKEKKEKKLIDDKIFFIYLGSFLSFVAFLFMPNSRFGGYNFLSFFLFIIFFIKFKNNRLKNDTRYILNIFLIIGLIYFTSKNIYRIKYEIKNSLNFPNIKIANIDYNEIQKFSFSVNLSNHEYFCGNIKFICVPKNNLEGLKDIKKISGYLFFYSNSEEIIKKINNETKDILYERRKFSIK
jgi:hypothetical protein